MPWPFWLLERPHDFLSGQKDPERSGVPQEGGVPQMMNMFVNCFRTTTVGTDRRVRAAKDVHVMPIYLRGACNQLSAL